MFQLANPNFRQAVFVNYVVADIISLTLNFILLYFVVTLHHPGLKPYKKVLVFSIIVDISYASFALVNQTTYFVQNDIYYVVPNGILPLLPANLNLVINMGHLFFHYLCITVIPVNFIYRCYLVFRSKQLSLLPFLAVILLPITATMAYVIVFAFALLVEKSNIEKYSQFFKDVNWLDRNGNVPLFFAAPYANNTTRTFASFLIIIPYTITVICAIATTIKLRKMQKTMLPKTRNLQSQITLVLFIQALIPLVTLVFPMSFHVAATKMPLTSYITQFIMIWSPFFNPLVAIIVLTPYRRAAVIAVKDSFKAIMEIFDLIKGAPIEFNVTISSSSVAHSSQNRQRNGAFF